MQYFLFLQQNVLVPVTSFSWLLRLTIFLPFFSSPLSNEFFLPLLITHVLWRKFFFMVNNTSCLIEHSFNKSIYEACYCPRQLFYRTSKWLGLLHSPYLKGRNLCIVYNLIAHTKILHSKLLDFHLFHSVRTPFLKRDVESGLNLELSMLFSSFVATYGLTWFADVSCRSFSSYLGIELTY